ncbi:MAG: hypothetical protein PVF83_17260 [Anaerolineales bacterium]|jgi:hypothetical protein
MKIRETIRNRKEDIYAIVILVILLILIFAPVFYIGRNSGDFGTAAARAKRLADGGQLESPHFLYQILIIVIHSIFPFIGFYSSGVIAVMIAFIVFGVVLYCYLRPSMGEGQSYSSSTITGLFVLVLMLFAPITLFTLKSRDVYFGYISPTIYHNATYNLLKPFTLILFIISFRIFNWDINKKNKGTTFLLISLVLLSAITKPSYLICFLPALGIFAIHRYFLKQKVDWKLLFFGVMIPGAIILGIQYFITYIPGIELIDYPGSGIKFRPFYVMSHWSSWLFPKFLLSIFFPLCVYISYYKEAKQNTELSLSWLTFFFGAFYTYMFAEAKRPYHANFLWSGVTSLLILFITSLKFFIIQVKSKYQKFVWGKLNIKAVVNMGVLGLHFICGIPWYIDFITSNPIKWLD